MKNLVIVVLVILVSALVLALGWTSCPLRVPVPAVTVPTVLTAAPISIGEKPDSGPVAVTTKAPVAPESETDRVLKELGFRPSNQLSKITVK